MKKRKLPLFSVNSLSGAGWRSFIRENLVILAFPLIIKDFSLTSGRFRVRLGNEVTSLSVTGCASPAGHLLAGGMNHNGAHTRRYLSFSISNPVYMFIMRLFNQIPFIRKCRIVGLRVMPATERVVWSLHANMFSRSFASTAIGSSFERGSRYVSFKSLIIVVFIR